MVIIYNKILLILSKSWAGKVGRAEAHAGIGQHLMCYIIKCGLCTLDSQRERLVQVCVVPTLSELESVIDIVTICV